MNLSLLDPFQSDYPEVIEEYLEHGIAKCLAFNRRGTLLAAGCTDGACIIWDCDTRGVAREFRDPDCSAPVTSICWSKCGHRLLAASTAKLLVLWDVAKGFIISRVELQHAPLHCRLDPGTAAPYFCLACPLSGSPVVVDFNADTIHSLPVVVPTVQGNASSSSSRGKHGDSSARSTSTASFNRAGDLIYVGNFKGEILIVDRHLRKVRAVVAVPGGSAIRHIVFSRNGQFLLTNSNDRVIRVFENLLPRIDAASALAEMCANADAGENLKSRGLKCLKMGRDFQDAVNRMHWKTVCFNGDGECVIGASASKGEHKIHIWNRNFGQLARILEGPKEGLSDIAWHPTRPVVASASMSGAIYLWAKDYTENWSAFAPDFQELEENEEYVEREDEFDLPLDSDKVKAPVVDEDVEVDIMTTEKVAAFSDSDNSQDGLHFLPTSPIRDEPPEKSHVLPSAPPKQSSSSATESDRSPAVSEPEPEPKPKPSPKMEMKASQFTENENAAEEDVGQNGRVRRKRKLSEKAAELEAEKGRKFAQKTRAPKAKGKSVSASKKPIITKEVEVQEWTSFNGDTFKGNPSARVPLKPDEDEESESTIYEIDVD